MNNDLALTLDDHEPLALQVRTLTLDGFGLISELEQRGATLDRRSIVESSSPAVVAVIS
jgi:hypothetical protein